MGYYSEMAINLEPGKTFSPPHPPTTGIVYTMIPRGRSAPMDVDGDIFGPPDWLIKNGWVLVGTRNK